MDTPLLISELRRSMARLDAAVGQIKEGLVLVNEAGEVLWSNASFNSLTGRPRLAILGHNLREILPPNSTGKPILTFEQCRGGITKTGTIISLLSQDPLHAVEVEWRPVTSEEPNPILFIFRDISDRLSRDELQQQLDQAEQSLDDEPAGRINRRHPPNRRKSRLTPLIATWAKIAKITSLPWAILASGLLITAAVGEQTRRFGAQEHLRIEGHLLENVESAIESRLAFKVSILSAMAGLFNASDQVDRDEFNAFYQTIIDNSPALKGSLAIGFAHWIPAAQLTRFESGIRAQGFPDFSVRPPGSRQDYSIIEFIAPFNWYNERTFGVDMYVDPIRREAMQRAAASGRAALSGKVRLTQETDEDLQRGALIYLPAYGQKGSRGPAGSKLLLGWTYAPLRIKDLVEHALDTIDNPDLEGTGVLVFDGSQPLDANLLFDNKNLVRENRLAHPSFSRINLAGRTWLVGVQLAPWLVGPSGITAAFWMNLLLGSGISAIATLLTRILVSKHLATREALAISEQASQEQALATTVFEESAQGIVISNPEGHIMRANSSFCQLSGYRISEVKGQRTNLLKSDRHDAAFYKAMWDTLLQKGFWEGEIWNQLRSGEVRRHQLSISTVRDEHLQVSHYVGMLQDVTTRHQAEERVRFAAEHDTLTGLANRSLLMEQLECQLSLAKRHHHLLALLFIDLDGFKPINDQFGHQVGDHVLQVIAERFGKELRREDLLCRVGGDEFVVLVPHAGSVDDLMTLATKLVTASRMPIRTSEHTVSLSASVGLAVYPDHGDHSDQLIAAADQAMYAAKRSKANGVVLFTRP